MRAILTLLFLCGSASAADWARLAPLQFRAAGKRQVEGAVEGLERLFE